MIDDDALVRRAQRGDRAAFGELVRRHQDRVHGVCRRMLGDPSSAEEAAQDVFLSAWRALDRFRGEARFDTWLHTIAINRCRNRRTSRQRRGHGRHVPLDADDGPTLQLVHPGPPPDRAAQRSDARDAVTAALDTLDPDHREIIVLRDLQDLDYDEIATILNVARGTVKSRLHRARHALADALHRRLGREDVLG